MAPMLLINIGIGASGFLLADVCSQFVELIVFQDKKKDVLDKLGIANFKYPGTDEHNFEGNLTHSQLMSVQVPGFTTMRNCVALSRGSWKGFINWFRVKLLDWVIPTGSLQAPIKAALITAEEFGTKGLQSGMLSFLPMVVLFSIHSLTLQAVILLFKDVLLELLGSVLQGAEKGERKVVTDINKALGTDLPSGKNDNKSGHNSSAGNPSKPGRPPKLVVLDSDDEEQEELRPLF